MHGGFIARRLGISKCPSACFPYVSDVFKPSRLSFISLLLICLLKHASNLILLLVLSPRNSYLLLHCTRFFSETMNHSMPLTQHLNAPATPAPSSRYPSHYPHNPSHHPTHTHPAPFSTLTKSFDTPPGSYHPTHPYPTHLNIPSTNTAPQPSAPVTSLGIKQREARAIKRPWAGMGTEQPDYTQDNQGLSSNYHPHPTSTLRQSDHTTPHQSYSSTPYDPSQLSPSPAGAQSPQLRAPITTLLRPTPLPVPPSPAPAILSRETYPAPASQHRGAARNIRNEI